MLPTSVAAYTSSLADRLSEVLGTSLVGVYVHGSAALGGFVEQRSDVDVIIVVDAPLDTARRTAAAEVLGASHDECPGVGLECSVVTVEAAGSGGASCAYELHVSTSPADAAMILGGEHDPDLVLHFAVCRQSAVPVFGPAPTSVFAEVPAAAIRRQIAEELRWCSSHGAAHYAVLNACRALTFLETGKLVSKIDGGRLLMQQRLGADHDLAAVALAVQQGAAGSLTASAVAAFVRTALDEVEQG